MGLCTSKASAYGVDEDKLAGPSVPATQRENSAASTTAKTGSQRSLRVARSPSGNVGVQPSGASGSAVNPNLSHALQSLLSKEGPDDDDDDGTTQAMSTGGAALGTTGSARLLERHFSQHINSFMNRSGTLSRVASRDLSYLPPSAELLSDNGVVVLTDLRTDKQVILKRLIGRGGYGRVYLGELDGRPVAVKAVIGQRPLSSGGRTDSSDGQESSAQERMESMAQLEAVLMSAMEHPNIIRTYKVLSSSQTVGDHIDFQQGAHVYEWFIIMELCALGSLWTALLAGTFHSPLAAEPLEGYASHSSAQPTATQQHLRGHRPIQRSQSHLGPTSPHVQQHQQQGLPQLGAAVVGSPEGGSGVGAAAPAHGPGGVFLHSGPGVLSGRESESSVSTGASSLSSVTVHSPVASGAAAAAMRRTHEQQRRARDGMAWDAWAALETLREVTSALQYLHANGVLHGDLKVANVLLASSRKDRRGFAAKVTDFGFSRVLQKDGHIQTKTYGTVTHMPPELLSRGLLCPAADVFSMGVCMWEVLTGKAVFKELSDAEVIFQVVSHGRRPEWPPDAPTRYRRLAERCMAPEPEARPTLTDLDEELLLIQRELCPNGSSSPLIPVCARLAYRRPPAPTVAGMRQHLPPGKSPSTSALPVSRMRRGSTCSVVSTTPHTPTAAEGPPANTGCPRPSKSASAMAALASAVAAVNAAGGSSSTARRRASGSYTSVSQYQQQGGPVSAQHAVAYAGSPVSSATAAASTSEPVPSMSRTPSAAHIPTRFSMERNKQSPHSSSNWNAIATTSGNALAPTGSLPITTAGTSCGAHHSSSSGGISGDMVAGMGRSLSGTWNAAAANTIGGGTPTAVGHVEQVAVAAVMTQAGVHMANCSSHSRASVPLEPWEEDNGEGLDSAALAKLMEQQQKEQQQPSGGANGTGGPPLLQLGHGPSRLARVPTSSGPTLLPFFGAGHSSTGGGCGSVNLDAGNSNMTLTPAFSLTRPQGSITEQQRGSCEASGSAITPAAFGLSRRQGSITEQRGSSALVDSLNSEAILSSALTFAANLSPVPMASTLDAHLEHAGG